MIGRLPLGKEKINGPSKLKSSLSGRLVPSGTEIHLKDMLYLIRVTFFLLLLWALQCRKGRDEMVT